MKPLETKSMSPLTIVMQPHAGAVIGWCMVEAAKLSLEHECNVEFNHNGKLYQVLFNDLVGCVKERK